MNRQSSWGLKRLLLITILMGTVDIVQSQNVDSAVMGKISAFTYEASYTGDYLNNFRGGLKTGSLFLGMANIGIDFNTHKALLWNGGEFYIKGTALHGDSPTEKLLGDFQVASNIDGGNHVFLQELWFKQKINKLEFCFGLQDLNAEFASSENAGMFINSSFGIPPVISSNQPVPIFPLTTIGALGKWYITDSLNIKAAIFDGCPTAFDHNVNNTNWDFSKDDGILFTAELEYSKLIAKKTGTYKLGYYNHTSYREYDSIQQKKIEVFKRNYGMYAIIDQTIWQNEKAKKSLAIFAHTAISPSHINQHDYYFGGGLNVYGLLDKRGKNALGLAIAHAAFNEAANKHETVIEGYYKLQCNENISLQPDMQYIIHPSGTDTALENALVGFVRLRIAF